MANRSKIEVVLSAITQGFESRLRSATTAVKGLGDSAMQAERGGLSAARRGVLSISNQLENLRNAAVAAFSVNAVRGYAAQFVSTADAMRNMDQRLLLTAKNTNDYAAAQKTVADVAAASHQGLAEVSTLYTRMALATANLNVSQQELAEVTRTVALATALSGSSASEASAGLQQFAQAMASNRLGGDELRSVLENMPLLTKVFVDAAGGSIATLREMAEKGELTTQWMIDAIKAAKETIEAQAAAIPLTVGRAMTDLRNEASKYVTSVDQTTGATDTLAVSIQWLGQNLDMVAKGGAMALAIALSILAGRGLAAAAAGVGSFVGRLGALSIAATASGTAVSSAAAYMSGSYTAATTTAAAATASRLMPALLGLVNPITAITTVLGIGAAAWALWAEKANDAVGDAEKRLAEIKRINQMLKEQSDPGIKLQEASARIIQSKAEVAKLEQELREVYSGEGIGDLNADIKLAEAKLERSKKTLALHEQEYEAVQENIKISAEQRGAKEIAVELSVTDEIKKQNEERRKITASQLENDLAEIEQKRQAELKASESRFQGEDRVRVQQAINARFDTAAAQAKKEAAEAESKKADAAARKAEAEAKRREREMLKEERLQGKIDIEKLRAQSEANILALEEQKIAAENSGSELERAEKLLKINEKIHQEKLDLLEAEKKRISEDPSKSEADVIRAESAILKEKIAGIQQKHRDLADIAQASLTEVEEAWRSGTASVNQYIAALEAANKAGVLTDKQLKEKKIGAGDNMWAAFGQGISNARARMQSDGEMMIYIGENIGNQISDGLVSAWDSFITRSKSAKEALVDFARSTISWLSQVILKQMLMSALMGAPGTTGGGLFGMLGLADGGAVQALASGGSVAGRSPSKTADNIPIWATAGEFMQPVRAVDYYGLAFMERIRQLQFPRHIAHALAGGTIPSIPSGFRLAQGGAVPGQAPATTVKAGDTRLRVINVLDRNMVGDYLRTADGETAIINMIRRNGSTVNTILGR